MFRHFRRNLSREGVGPCTSSKYLLSRVEVALAALHSCSLPAVEGTRVLRSVFAYYQLRIYTTCSISQSQLSSILQFSMSAYCTFSVTPSRLCLRQPIQHATITTQQQVEDYSRDTFLHGRFRISLAWMKGLFFWNALSTEMLSRVVVAPAVSRSCSILVVEGGHVLRSIFDYCRLRMYTAYSISQ